MEPILSEPSLIELGAVITGGDVGILGIDGWGGVGIEFCLRFCVECCVEVCFGVRLEICFQFCFRVCLEVCFEFRFGVLGSGRFSIIGAALQRRPCF